MYNLWALSNSAPTPTHSNPPPPTQKIYPPAPTQTKYLPAYLHPPKIMPHPSLPTQNNAPLTPNHP